MLRPIIIRCFRNSYTFDNVVIKNSVHTCVVKNVQSTVLSKKSEKSNLIAEKQPSTLSEQQFLVRLKADPDKFGNFESETDLTEDDIKEEKHFTEQPLPSQRLSTKKYADIIKDLISKRKIKEAIDVVEVRMLKQDRVKPENYIYNLLLGACGRVGYTKKAFMLYNDMKKRGLKVTGGTYTALFNACANSPWPTTDGLTRATHLRNIMIEKGYQPNDTNYNAMIKAFGRCGDHSMAFSLVDEMITKGIPVKDDSINFLLQACIADKEAGFRHALLIWRKLIDKNIKPSIYTYNLLLRCVRDCGLGDTDVTKNVIDTICKQDKLLEASDIKSIDTNGASSDDSSIESDKIDCNIDRTGSNIESSLDTLNSRPNLLATVPHLGNIISLSEITQPEHRLLLIGGCKEFLENMKSRECKPDIKTFTQLLDCIPSSLASEKELLNIMKKEGVKPDIDFYNMLIKKRSMRFDYENAKEVLKLIDKAHYRPDLITYGVLALGCRNKNECIELVSNMKEACYTLNIEILGAMLSQACHHLNFNYVIHVMELCVTENISPNKKFIETLEIFRKRIKYMRKDKPLTSSFIKDVVNFKIRYKKWITEVEIDESENAHPWQQFRETNSNQYRFKLKDTARFKARHTSRFKVKTSTKKRY
ncbi:pentatricopeptide repeat-containing protein 1, mitochondrial [Diorhabda carinulata]|uniref:pentatricopeptide repeat-containing protein 1, mitochondrial n=1 Tax=Diorhabda carinulata TaxID=1163345 RepID=UPI0025A1A16B|nr:pentatricopeptide repeat-containing protein 1, mitochondrial [Diorhabda carinulata]